MTQYCNDYGDRAGCLGTPDEQYTMHFDDIGEKPILWCAFCGPAAHALDAALAEALDNRGLEFTKQFASLVDAATKDLYKQ